MLKSPNFKSARVCFMCAELFPTFAYWGDAKPGFTIKKINTFHNSYFI